MNAMQERISRLKELFRDFKDDFDRYSYLLELAALLPASEEVHAEQWRFSGCQSRVWIRATDIGGTCRFEADSDTLLIRGVLYLYAALLEGQPVDQVLRSQIDLLDALGIRGLFPSKRGAGISSLMEEIKRQLQA